MAAMFNTKSKDWQEFKKSAPGKRFQDVYHKREKKAGKGNNSGLGRGLWIAAGVLLIAAGVVLAFMPGPGSLVMLGGVALIARESLVVAKFLDRLEVWLSPYALKLRRWWRGMSGTQHRIIIGTAVVVGLAAAALFYGYVLR